MLTYTATESSKGAELFLPPLGEVVLSAIIVGLIALVLVKFALPKYNAIADERARIIREGIAATEQAKHQAAAAESKADETISAAHREAAEIRETAHQDGKGIVAEARTRAKLEADRITENAQRQLEADRKAAQAELRADVGRLASQLADRIVGEHLQDEALSARVIDRFLDEMDVHEQAVAYTEEKHS